MNMLAALRAIATVKPYMEVSEALTLAEAVCDKPRPRRGRVPVQWWKTHEGRVAFARKCPEIQALLPNKRIQAIKELREQADRAQRQANDTHRWVGLKEAKDAIDTVCPYTPAF